MPISIVCPACSAKINAADKTAGKRVKCPKCGEVLRVPSATGPTPDWVQDSPLLPARSVPKKPAAASKPPERESSRNIARNRKPGQDASESEVEPNVLEVIPPPQKDRHGRSLFVAGVTAYFAKRLTRRVIVISGVAGFLIVGFCCGPLMIVGMFYKAEKPVEIFPDGTETLSKHQVKENLKALARAQGLVWNGEDRKLPGVYRFFNDVNKAVGRWRLLEQSENIDAPWREVWKAECTDGAIYFLDLEVSSTALSTLEIIKETNEPLRPGIPYSKATPQQIRDADRWDKEHPE
jgi:hypothetical protein